MTVGEWDCILKSKSFRQISNALVKLRLSCVLVHAVLLYFA